MNRRKGIVLLIATLMIISMVMVFPLPVTAADPPTVTVTFPNTTSSSVDEYDVGATFIVDIMADSNVLDVWSWQSGIYFDPSVLQVTNLGAGNFFAGKVVLVFTAGTIDNTAGHVSFSGSSLKSPDETQGVIGAGSLMWYEFTVIGYGAISLGLTDTTDTLAGTGLWTTNLGTTGPQLIATTILTSGSFDNTGLKPPPEAPTVDFTYLPTAVYENDIVTFTATTTDGFDGDNFIAVSEYRWDFDGDASVDLVTAVPTADFNYTTAGSYNPSVEVYAGPNTAGTEYETASTSKPLTVYAVALSYIDVYTELAGSGPDQYGSAFEPGEEVTLSADVLFNGVPVPSGTVAFQILDKTGDTYDVRTAELAAGVATTSIRLPLVGTTHLTDEADFGLFTVVATATPFGEPFTDTVTLYVGWKVDTVPPPSATDAVIGGSTDVTVTINNYALETQPVFLTITARDSVGVTIGVYSTSFTISAASPVGLGVDPYLAVEGATITIPLSAWPGPATVYVNAFDAEPLLGGDAWCPEISTTFAIS